MVQRFSGPSPSPSLELILQQYTCSLSMREGLTPGLMETGKSSMKVVQRFSGPKLWNKHGRTNLRNGKKDQRPDFQNGLEYALAKKEGDPDTPEGEEDGAAE